MTMMTMMTIFLLILILVGKSVAYLAKGFLDQSKATAATIPSPTFTGTWRQDL